MIGLLCTSPVPSTARISKLTFSDLIARRKIKFTDSPVIDLQVLNTHLSFQQDNATMHIGTSVWQASLVLVKFAERWYAATDSPYTTLLNFSGKWGIELGSGCGVGAMGLYVLGLHDVVATDIAPVMPSLKHNLKWNKPALNKALKVAQLYWANEAQINAMGLPFDIVVAADVVYIEESVAPLLETMGRLVADDGAVLLGYQVRSPEAHILFWALCAERFEIEKILHHHLHPDYAYEETDFYVLRKKLKREVSEEGQIQ